MRVPGPMSASGVAHSNVSATQTNIHNRGPKPLCHKYCLTLEPHMPRHTAAHMSCNDLEVGPIQGIGSQCHFKPVAYHHALVLCLASQHESQKQSYTHWGTRPTQSHSQPPAPHCHDSASVHTTSPRHNTSVLQTGWYAANQQTPPKPNKNSSPHTMWLPGAPTQCRTCSVIHAGHPSIQSTTQP